MKVRSSPLQSNTLKSIEHEERNNEFNMDGTVCCSHLVERRDDASAVADFVRLAGNQAGELGRRLACT